MGLVWENCRLVAVLWFVSRICIACFFGDFPPIILLVSSFGDFDGIDEQFTNGVAGAKHQTIAASGEHVEVH